MKIAITTTTTIKKKNTQAKLYAYTGFTFVLNMLAKTEWILADEHHVVGLRPVNREARQLFMCLVDLATCNQIEGDVKTARNSFTEYCIDV